MSWTSGLNMGGVGTLLPQVKPWQRFDWKSCLRSRILRDWGTYYIRRSLNQTALETLKRAEEACKLPDNQESCMITQNTAAKRSMRRTCMDRDRLVCSNDYKTLYHRIRCHRAMANTEKACEDAQLAQRAVSVAMEQLGMGGVVGVAEIVQEKCHALLDANEFERCLATVFDEGRAFHSQNAVRQFRKIQRQVSSTLISDPISDRRCPCSSR